MTTFPVTIHNFVKNVHYQLQFKETRVLQLHHLTKQMTDEDLRSNLHYLAITEDGNIQSTNLRTILHKLKTCYTNKPLTLIISFEKIQLGKSLKQQHLSETLTVMINNSIRIDLDDIFLPITWTGIKEQIYERLSNNSITLNSADLAISDDWKVTKGCTSTDECICLLNNELHTYGQTIIYVETVTKTNKNLDNEFKGIIPKNQIMAKNSLNEMMQGLEKLEESIEKMTTDDICVNIPLKNEELFEFYDKIKTEKQLIDLKHSYEKYQQWLTLYGNDENKIESYLINHNEAHNSLIQISNNISKRSSITTTTAAATTTIDAYNNTNISVNSGILFPSPYNIPNVIKNFLNLKIFILDLNVCFKFTNEQDVSLPPGLSLEFEYRIKQSTKNGNEAENDSILRTYCIDLIHGCGANVTKTFTRFKYELGTKFHIQDIENARIVKRDTINYDDDNNNTNNKKTLYTGVRDYFKEEHDDKPVRIFNFEINRNDFMTRNVSDANDIISTSIENTNSVLLNIDEYDLLTETDSNV